MRTAPVTVIVAALALVLSGCAADAPGDPKTAAPRPTGVSTPAAVRTPAPDCAALATADQVAALVGGDGAPRTPEHLDSGGIGLNPIWATVAANGATCGWGAETAASGANIGAPSVALQVVPGLEGTWNALVDELSPSAGSAYDGGVSRGGTCEAGLVCSTEVLVRGSWLHVQAQNVTGTLSESDFHDFVQGVVTRYLALPAPTVMPGVARACDAPELRAAFAAAFGDEGVLAPDPSTFTLTTALIRAGYQTFCRFDTAAGGRGWETFVSVVDGATPGLVQTYRTQTDHPESTAVDVSTLGGDASGLFEPSVDSERTIVDVLGGSRWLNLVTYNTKDSARTVALAKTLLAGDWLTGAAR